MPVCVCRALQWRASREGGHGPSKRPRQAFRLWRRSSGAEVFCLAMPAKMPSSSASLLGRPCLVLEIGSDFSFRSTSKVPTSSVPARRSAWRGFRFRTSMAAWNVSESTESPPAEARKLGRQERVKEILDGLDQGGFQASSDTFAHILEVCASLKSLSEGKRAHAHIVRSGLERDMALGNHLVEMYLKCGSLEDARRMFDKLPERGVFLWNAIVAAYAGCGNYREALQLCQWMKREGAMQDSRTFVPILSSCANWGTLAEGKLVHASIVDSGLESDVSVGTTIVNLYGKCGSLKDARQVFDKIYRPNVVSWTTMIAAYSQHGHYEEALRLFRQMQLQGIIPNKITFVTILTAFFHVETLPEGKLIHAHIVEAGFASDIVVGNAVVNMYGKCGSLDNARRVFNNLQRRDVVSWTAMIAAYVQLGHYNDAFQLFRQMQFEGINPNKITFVTILNACADTAAIAEGRLIHAHIIVSELEANIVVGNALLSMYSRCGSLENACQIFGKLQQRDAVSWTAMIAAYSRHGRLKESLKLFQWMHFEGVVPKKISFITILNACTSTGAMGEGKLIHAFIIDTGFESDIMVGTALVSMYGRCGGLDDARRAFDKIHRWDVSMWNSMIAVYVQCDHCSAALELFLQMLQEGLMPNNITFFTILHACTSPVDLADGKLIHSCIADRGLESDVVGSALVNMYGKCGSLEEACRLFDKMYQHDVVSWTAMISAYARHGLCKECLQCFEQMQLEGVMPNVITFASILNACASTKALEEGKLIHAHIVDSGVEPDVALENAIVNMYGKCGCVEDAYGMFHRMQQRSVIAWSLMIATYAHHGLINDAFQSFEQMQVEGVVPNKITFVSMLNACASAAALAEGKLIHACTVESGLESDMLVGNAIIDMYGKCGILNEAREVFAKMLQRDGISWTAMITAYAQHGHCDEALELYEQMLLEGVKPVAITFVSILSACSHAGLVDEGYHYFNSMSKAHNVSPTAEHYGCMIDLLGRAGQLVNAENFINRIPVEPDAVVWMTLLGACGIHSNLQQGEHVAEHVLELDPQNAAAYVVLSNIYTAAGRWDDAATVRKVMADRGVQKEPGCSSIEIENGVHEFLVGDRWHPQMEEIHAELERLNRQMEEAGYVPDTKLVLHDVNEEQKGYLLCCHSEKLAIGFGLISTACGAPLRIIKNLRVCSDCHTAAKFISKISGREITVRDAQRFHCFKDGVCSCRDYW